MINTCRILWYLFRSSETQCICTVAMLRTSSLTTVPSHSCSPGLNLIHKLRILLWKNSKRTRIHSIQTACLLKSLNSVRRPRASCSLSSKPLASLVVSWASRQLSRWDALSISTSRAPRLAGNRTAWANSSNLKRRVVRRVYSATKILQRTQRTLIWSKKQNVQIKCPSAPEASLMRLDRHAPALQPTPRTSKCQTAHHRTTEWNLSEVSRKRDKRCYLMREEDRAPASPLEMISSISLLKQRFLRILKWNHHLRTYEFFSKHTLGFKICTAWLSIIVFDICLWNLWN